MKSYLRIGLAIIIGILCSYSLAWMGTRWRLRQSDPNLDLTTKPHRIMDAYVASSKTNGWIPQQFGASKFLVPEGWKELKRTKKNTVWGNDVIQVMISLPGKLQFRRYQRSLYQTWNILALRDRAILLPRLESEAPRIIEQPIGTWLAYIFPVSSRWVHVDLFKDNLHVSVTFLSKYDFQAIEEIIKDFLSHVTVEHYND